MTDSSRSMPLYHQVANILRQRILESTYPAGMQLLPEEEQAAEFGVSRATFRQAISMLVSEGLIVRQQGRGTFVEPSDKHVSVPRVRGPLSDVIRQSRGVKFRDIEIAHDQPFPEYVATALNMSTGRGTIVRQTRLIDSKPFAFSMSYLPDNFGYALSVEIMQRNALLEILIKEGVAIRSATQSIRAELADLEICTRLGVDPGTAVLYVERLVNDNQGNAVEFVRCWYRGDRYEYTVTLDLGSESVDDPFDHFA